MRKHRGKIITAAIVCLLLAGSWVLVGSYAGHSVSSETSSVTPVTAAVVDLSEDPGAVRRGADSLVDVTVNGEPEPEGTDAPAAANTNRELNPSERVTGLDVETSKDKYLTDPVPQGKPVPVEPQNAVLTGDEFTCTLTVRCDTVLDNMDLLDKEKRELIPGDGVIFPTADVTVYEGESVFNVLLREMKRAKIHMEFMKTPIYNSAYIEGISNIYEFDAGELSGWMYNVNDWYPNYGCSRYTLKDGDVIELRYTCDLGRDLGVDWISDFQRDE
ncbi:MAG: DUF4430 domain-containing protein [Clostridiales Family XIII bacterium]|jgi:hypothetical protein|nr:DUF4430 domain-containing protein [Clostridiales Family XIII bacterium]